MFDVRCANGHEDEQFSWRADDLDPCRACGAAVDRVALPSRSTVIGDEWPGGGPRTFYNMDHRPVTCANKTEWRREMAKRGVTPYGGRFGVHQGDPGSDKNRHTTRWQ